MNFSEKTATISTKSKDVKISKEILQAKFDADFPQYKITSVDLVKADLLTSENVKTGIEVGKKAMDAAKGGVAGVGDAAKAEAGKAAKKVVKKAVDNSMIQ